MWSRLQIEISEASIISEVARLVFFIRSSSRELKATFIVSGDSETDPHWTQNALWEPARSKKL